jgi:ATP-dependent DNA helicase RecQ
MLETLKKYFGYESFRPLQAEIINTVLAGRDALVIMPTGGGKSLCYQLPAILQEGLTIVVSPLISLMKDQVDSLTTNGIDAAYWNSSLSAAEVATTQRDLETGKTRLLYMAPERLMLPNFLTYLKKFPIHLFAIDEAHCISEWGHDFRPEYRQLQILKSHFPATPMIALTATATPRVQEDIGLQLRMVQPQVFKASFNRENLYYEIRPKTRTYEQIYHYLKEHPGDSGIIYCFSRRTTEQLTEKLHHDGFRALPYHAGLESEVRTRNQEKFIHDDVDIIVATIAFGMGIDKPNVRFVMHYDLPKNLEGYYQETGRAGRDSLKSDCILFFSYGDRKKIEYFFAEIQDPAELKVAYEKLDQVTHYAESTVCRRKLLLNYFGESYPETNCGSCDNCVHQAEQFDATIAAQKFFSCVARVSERFGINYVIDVLRGSRSERLIHNRHNSLSTYGIGQEYSKKEWLTMARELIQKKYLVLTEDEYPVLRLTPLSKEVLFQQAKVLLTKSRQPIAPAPAAEAELPVNRELFELLRQSRKQLADTENLPPYLIFNDSTLKAMASRFPQSEAAMGKIPGVGELKLKRFAPPFLRVIRAFCQARQIQEIAAPPPVTGVRKKSPEVSAIGTEMVTYNLYKQDLSLEEIAQRRQLAVSTILGHLERLLVSGQAIDIQKFISAEKEQRIRQVFQQFPNVGLKPVKEALGNNFSYEDIRLVWAKMKREQSF